MSFSLSFSKRAPKIAMSISLQSNAIPYSKLP